MEIAESSVGALDATAGFEAAMERSKALLLRPFDVVTWLCFGVMVLLENLTLPNVDLRSQGENAGRALRQVWVQVLGQPFFWALAAGAAVVIVGIAVFALWIKSRATIMFVRAVATGERNLADNWRASARAGNSLCLFYLLMTGALLCLGGMATGAVMVVSNNFQREPNPAFLLLLAPFVLVVAVLYAALGCVVRNLVAPLMWKHDLRFGEAWRLFARIASGNVFALVLFVLVRFGVGLFLVFAHLTAAFVTLCACCIMWLPGVLETLLAPLHVWERAFSLYVLESLGPDFRILEPLGAPAPPPAAPSAEA